MECELVMTVADDLLYLWPLNKEGDIQPSSIHFLPLDHSSVFGGLARNASGKVFIFDMQVAPVSMAIPDPSLRTESESIANSHVTIALAMSDCTVRIESISMEAKSELYSPVSMFTSSEQPAVGHSSDVPVVPVVPVGTSKHIKLIPIQPYVIGDNGLGVGLNSTPIITSVVWRADAALLLASLGNGEIAIVDPQRGIVKKCFKAHSASCFGTAFCEEPEIPHQRLFISWSRDTTIRYEYAALIPCHAFFHSLTHSLMVVDIYILMLCQTMGICYYGSIFHYPNET